MATDESLLTPVATGGESAAFNRQSASGRAVRA
jgi:hypothetical protein